MKFFGDIIITDPCYIMKKQDVSKKPKYEDYFSKLRKEIDSNGITHIYYDILSYPDVRDETIDEYLEPYLSLNPKTINFLKRDYYNLKKEGNLPKISIIFQKEEKEYTKALKKWCEESDRDWDVTGCGEDFSPIGFTKFLTSYTGYGDWSCTTLEKGTNKKLGEFCADAGIVGVFLLDEVLKYNPNFDYHIQRPWTTTLIKNFNGDIEIKRNDEDGVYIEGRGNINFYTIQTGL